MSKWSVVEDDLGEGGHGLGHEASTLLTMMKEFYFFYNFHAKPLEDPTQGEK